MTATTTIQGPRATSSHRPVWAPLAFALAGAAIGSLATVAVTDADDGPAAIARTEAAPLEAGRSTSSAVSVSADAIERRSAAVTRNPDANIPSAVSVSADAIERRAAAATVAGLSTASAVSASADAIERRAAANADRTAACTSSATSADAAERCIAAR